MDGKGFGSILSNAWWVIEFVSNLIDDGIILSTSFLSFTQHMDLFNVGLMSGRLCKMLIAYYLEGILFRDYREYEY